MAVAVDLSFLEPFLLWGCYSTFGIGCRPGFWQNGYWYEISYQCHPPQFERRQAELCLFDCLMP